MADLAKLVTSKPSSRIQNLVELIEKAAQQHKDKAAKGAMERWQQWAQAACEGGAAQRTRTAAVAPPVPLQPR